MRHSLAIFFNYIEEHPWTNLLTARVNDWICNHSSQLHHSVTSLFLFLYVHSRSISNQDTRTVKENKGSERKRVQALPEVSLIVLTLNSSRTLG